MNIVQLALGWTAVSVIASPLIGLCLHRFGVGVGPRVGSTSPLDGVVIAPHMATSVVAVTHHHNQ